MQTSLEAKASHIEFFLSRMAAIPILGSLAAITKIALAIIQTVAGLVVCLASLPFVCTKKGRAFFFRGGSHLINGVANILAGALEAIPLIGSVIYFIRYVRSSTGLYSATTGVDANRRTIEVSYSNSGHMIFVSYKILAKEAEKTISILEEGFEKESIEKSTFFRQPLLFAV